MERLPKLPSRSDLFFKLSKTIAFVRHTGRVPPASGTMHVSTNVHNNANQCGTPTAQTTDANWTVSIFDKYEGKMEYMIKREKDAKLEWKRPPIVQMMNENSEDLINKLNCIVDERERIGHVRMTCMNCRRKVRLSTTNFCADNPGASLETSATCHIY